VARAWVSAAVVLAACASPVRIDVTVPPQDSTIESVFLVVEQGDRREVYAIDPTADPSAIDPAALPSVEDAPADLQIYSIASREPLTRFHIAKPGRVTTTHEEASFLLPTGERIERTEIRGGVAGPWVHIPLLPPDVAALRLPGSLSRCLKFHVRLVRMDAQVNSAVALDDRTALVVTENGPFFTVSADDFTPREVPVPSDAPRGRAHRDRNGKIWVFGQSGSTARFDIATRTLTRLPAMPASEEISFIEDGDDDAAGRFWVLGTRARFDAFENGQWVQHMHDDHGELRDFARGIAEHNGVVVTTGHDSTKVQVYGANGMRTEVSAPSNVGFGAAETVPGEGIILGGTDGTLYRFTPPATFAALPPGNNDELHSLAIYEIGRLDLNLFMGSPAGALGQYRLDEGYCKTVNVTATAIEEIVSVGPRDMVVVEDGLNQITWLTVE